MTMLTLDAALFLVFSSLILLCISSRKLSSVLLSLIIYATYFTTTNSYVLIQTSPIISIFITAVVISLVSAIIIWIMNKM